MNKLSKNKWRKVKLREVGKIVTGKTPPTAEKDYFDSDFPFITPTDITDFNIRYNYVTDRFLSKKWFVRAKNLLIPENSICFVCIGSTIGKICLTKKDSFTNQQINTVIVNPEKADFKYIYYLLKNNQGNVIKEYGGGGAAKAIINKSTFENIEFLILENVLEQKRIASILSAFDDKIELNNKINQNLEKIAQEIFKQWFVKFKFPGYKKAKFVDSELKKIPKGWEVKNLGDILTLEYGKALTSINRKKGSVPVYGSSGIVGYHDKKLVDGHGIIIGRAGIPGSIYWSQVDFHCVDSTFYVETKISKYFLFYLLKRQNLKSLISGSAVPGINRNIIYPNRIVLPLTDIINNFDKVISSIFLKIYKNKLENQKLISLRDLILPKLMSGEIKV